MPNKKIEEENNPIEFVMVTRIKKSDELAEYAAMKGFPKNSIIFGEIGERTCMSTNVNINDGALFAPSDLKEWLMRGEYSRALLESGDFKFKVISRLNTREGI